MLSKRELTAIKKVLPKNGFDRIAEKSGHTRESVKKILEQPDRFNKEVIEAALLVVEEYKTEIAELKNKIKQVTA